MIRGSGVPLEAWLSPLHRLVSLPGAWPLMRMAASWSRDSARSFGFIFAHQRRSRRPSPPLAPSIRQNIPFPASPPAHPGACEHWHDITDQSPIRPSSTTAATTPLSSPALSSRRSSRNYPRLQPLRRQIAIVGQASPPSHGFLHRRLSNAGPLSPGRSLTLGRHPKP